MEIVVGWDFEKFRQYYIQTMGKLGTIEEMIVKQDPRHLMIWKKNDQILGHAIWHEGNTKEHMCKILTLKEKKEVIKRERNSKIVLEQYSYPWGVSLISLNLGLQRKLRKRNSSEFCNVV